MHGLGLAPVRDGSTINRTAGAVLASSNGADTVTTIGNRVEALVVTLDGSVPLALALSNLARLVSLALATLGLASLSLASVLSLSLDGRLLSGDELSTALTREAAITSSIEETAADLIDLALAPSLVLAARLASTLALAVLSFAEALALHGRRSHSKASGALALALVLGLATERSNLGLASGWALNDGIVGIEGAVAIFRTIEAVLKTSFANTVAAGGLVLTALEVELSSISSASRLVRVVVGVSGGEIVSGLTSVVEV